MARRKKHFRRRTNWIDKAFGFLGALVAGGPAIEAVAENISTPQNIPGVVAYNYIGLQSDGSFSFEQAKKGLGTVAAGGVVASVPRIYRFVKGLVSGRR